MPTPFLYLPTHSIPATSSYAIPMHPRRPLRPCGTEATFPQSSSRNITQHQINQNGSSNNWNCSSPPRHSVPPAWHQQIGHAASRRPLAGVPTSALAGAGRRWPFRIVGAFIPRFGLIIVHVNNNYSYQRACSNSTFCLLLDSSVAAAAPFDGKHVNVLRQGSVLMLN